VSVGGLPDVVNGADVGVLKGPHSPRFTLEPFARRRRVSESRREDLDGHRPLESCVPCLVDLSHATRAEGG
jgi:hypothetical protein